MHSPPKKRIVLAVTGASGMAYARTLAENLRTFSELHLIVSKAATLVWNLEIGRDSRELEALGFQSYGQDDLAAPPASGSWQHQGMVVCPCSMASLAAIARGVGNNLIHRAADVTLKEQRRLVLVTRETPLGTIHLENMLAAARAGAVVMPACPGFYHRPGTLQELVDHLAGRILDALGIEHNLTARWGA